VIVTHAHPDHIEAAALFKQQGIKIAFHQKEWDALNQMQRHASGVYRTRLESVQPDFFLDEGDLDIDGLKLSIIHTPGHSPGSISIYWPEPKAMFTGDVVFKDGIGRTDLPGGKAALLKESIARLSTYQLDWVLPGHGPAISGQQQVKVNFDTISKQWLRHLS